MDALFLETVIGIIIALAAIFAIGETSGVLSHRAANTSLLQTASTAMNALVAVSGVSSVAAQTTAVIEINGIPTQIVIPAPPKPPA